MIFGQHVFRVGWLAAALLTLSLGPATGSAFGPQGHLIVGLAAQPQLCPRAARQIAAWVDEPFAELGWWADRIRDQRDESRPWHYLNIADGGGIADFSGGRDGDVLWAIRHFSRVLGDRSAARPARAEALKFLIHFIADIHQPLHVGRADDRGGNAVTVHYDEVAVNLHRFWDSDAIALAGLPPARYAAGLGAAVAAAMAVDGDLEPAVWAEESLLLRAKVYAFDASTGRLDARYLREAREIVEARLAQAAARTAKTLNAILCARRR